MTWACPVCGDSAAATSRSAGRRPRPARSAGRPTGRRPRGRARRARDVGRPPAPAAARGLRGGRLDCGAFEVTPWRGRAGSARRPGRRRRTARPRRRRRRGGRSSSARCSAMRAPDMPIGWPSAMAPPLTLTFSGSTPSSRVDDDADRGERLVDLDQVEVARRRGPRARRPSGSRSTAASAARCPGRRRRRARRSRRSGSGPARRPSPRS